MQPRAEPAGTLLRDTLVRLVGAMWPWFMVGVIDLLVIGSNAFTLIAYPVDWGVLAQIPSRLSDGTLYVHDQAYNYIWSPAAAWIIALAVLPLGYHVWFVLHAVSLAVLRDRQLIGLAVCSLPLWVDAGLGNTLAFVFVTAALAIRGSHGGRLAYLALCALMPRPLQLPLAAWLVVRDPTVRVPFAAMVTGVVGFSVATGDLGDWVAVMGPLAAAQAAGGANLGPTRFLGAGWLLIGIPLGAWLAMRGRLGLAGLAITPYLFPQYLLFALLETIRPADPAQPRVPPSPRPTEAPASELAARPQ
jgi:hypothetical protein